MIRQSNSASTKLKNVVVRHPTRVRMGLIVVIASSRQEFRHSFPGRKYAPQPIHWFLASTNQRLNDLTTQRLNDSTTQRINALTTQRLNDSTTQRLNNPLNDSPIHRFHNHLPSHFLTNKKANQLLDRLFY